MKMLRRLIEEIIKMSEYKYINDDEREWSQKYEGAYTPKEIELNKKLKEECSKDNIDYTIVEREFNSLMY